MAEGEVAARRARPCRLWVRALGRAGTLLAAALTGGVVALGACGSADPGTDTASREAAPFADTLPDSAFAAFHARISEDDGYFDTDNLISNETGYLKVLGALERLGLSGGAYVGVGPDQNFSYIAELRPEIAFITDIRRDNVLHHLLLKALVEGAATRVEFLSALHGRPAPEDAAAWRGASAEEVVAWVDGRPADPAVVASLAEEVAERVQGFGIPLSEADMATIRRFHESFVREGLDLRFTSYGRRPRPYYPTYRQLVLETDVEGGRVSWLTSAERYGVVRALQLANRVVPVVGDLAGPRALEEMGRVLREMGLKVTTLYTSNVEFYLWRNGTFDRWARNLASLPLAEDAVIIRSYFPNLGRHPAALPGYYATQLLQAAAPVAEAAEGPGFDSYADLVTRDLIELRVPAGVR